MSEAAKPADPERALARITSLRASYVNEHSPLYRDESRARLAHALVDAVVDGWLLPLARAGLRAAHPVAAVADLERLAAYETLAEGFAKRERDALRVEFAACVRALARLTEIDVLSTDGVTYRLTASSVAAIALAQPLAAAVLRSPEPATPADGGA